MNDIKTEILKTHKKWRTREAIKNPTLVKYLREKYGNIGFKEQLYLFINELTAIPICLVPECNKTVKFKGTYYSKTCSYKCSNALKKTNNKIENIVKKQKQTFMKKYGVENPSQNKQIIEKRKKTNIKKYGTANGVLGLLENKIKSKNATSNKKYIKEKIQRFIKKYGVENPSQLPNHKEKVKQTLLSNYGVDHYYKSEKFKKIQQLKRMKYAINLCSNTIEIKNIDSPSIEKLLLYTNPNYIINFTCKICNNTDSVPHETFKFRLKRFSNICSTCLQLEKPGISASEKEVLDYIKSIYKNTNIFENDKSILNLKELDIYLPDINLAIEYCGLYWHSDAKISDSYYHYNKMIESQNKNIRLITIFEDEWIYKKNIVKNRLKYIISNESIKKIHARKCVIKEISQKTAKNFINKYHIQGYTNSSIKLGLYNNDILVSVMTFSKPNISKGYKNYSSNVWELSRFCSSCNIRGGASKLFKYFINNFSPLNIFTYSDLRWNTGNLYEKIGMIYQGKTTPGYWYINHDKRIHRFKLRKTKNDPKNISELELRKSEGWKRIWDCGHAKYLWNKKTQL